MRSILLACVAAASFAACEQHKRATIDESGTEIVKIRKPAQDTIDKQAEPPAQTVTVTGKVIEVKPGKDGYTATIETTENDTCDATVSRANLADPGQYKTVQAGNKVNVSGDSWKLGARNQITVRQIH